MCALDATVVYRGPSGYPGLNQLDVTVPNGVATGCNVSLVGVSAAGVPTNFLSFPIGNGVCSDPVSGATGTQLQSGSGQGTVNTGIVELLLDTQPASSGGGTQTIGEAAGFFESTTGTSYGSSSGSVSIGGCVVTQSVTTSTTTTTGLDAGSISVTGPSGTVTLSSEGTAGYYISQLTSGFIAAGGTYTFKGTGGANVGPFSASVTFPNPLLSWNNTASFAAVPLGSAGFRPPAHRRSGTPVRASVTTCARVARSWPSGSWSGFTSVMTSPPNFSLPVKTARAALTSSSVSPAKCGKFASGKD